MKIEAKIIADSKNEFGDRITTMIVTFPRFILAELNTHRMFSRNSASSRAIPFEKMVKSVEENPFIPIAWQKDHKGMQGTEYLNEDESAIVKRNWLSARNEAIVKAKELNQDGVTKQLCNRLLEPFMWHTVIITATEFQNFFELRCPQYGGTDSKNKEIFFKSKKDAYNHLINQGVNIQHINLEDTIGWLQINKGQSEIHMMVLAECMWDAMNESTPKELKENQWHIPFRDKINDGKAAQAQSPNVALNNLNLNLSLNDVRVKIATAMCARVSYTVIGEEDKPINYENDIKLHDNLAKSGHWSPFEHCARAMNIFDNEWSNNFKGFIQYRQMLNYKL